MSAEVLVKVPANIILLVPCKWSSLDGAFSEQMGMVVTSRVCSICENALSRVNTNLWHICFPSVYHTSIKCLKNKPHLGAIFKLRLGRRSRLPREPWASIPGRGGHKYWGRKELLVVQEPWGPCSRRERAMVRRVGRRAEAMWGGFSAGRVR